MEEYLTVDELSSKIKFSKQSLYNLIYKKTFILGKHYFKPTPKKILFKWSEIQAWIERPSTTNHETLVNESARKSPYDQKHKGQPAQNTTNSSINI
jgi:hypothetical protein